MSAVALVALVAVVAAVAVLCPSPSQVMMAATSVVEDGERS
jgi:hypothetical protein